MSDIRDEQDVEIARGVLRELAEEATDDEIRLQAASQLLMFPRYAEGEQTGWAVDELADEIAKRIREKFPPLQEGRMPYRSER